MGAPTDRRLLASTGKVAAEHLRGLVDAERFVTPTAYRVAMVVTDLLSAPHGSRERQLLRGEIVNVVHVEKGMAFGYAEKDGYVGWIDIGDVLSHPKQVPTHRIAAARSYAKSTSGLKTMGLVTPLSMGTRLVVLGEDDGWARIAWDGGKITRDLYVPSGHLAPDDHVESDPVAVAERLIGTPYLWGGNASFGIDCSGLVQMALLACGIPCPGDSDLQEAHFAEATSPYQRGDLLFWKGHVAMVCDPDTLVHANAHHMAVAHEPINAAIARIATQGDGPVTAHRRPELP
ncbi:C40 family peptidase [Shimia marina]|uniref:Dipeptidyl-peptidase 6 n=1 Tax=Shimia marina TaxID=321267 RepID=A0A0N7LS30_9RHOB|nr:NlpC/P60 family protein [Shimia marina]CUH52476.1 Dipeptidyl-peptidase 6 [Shimia marina]SFE12810.1 Cell wall-associated hydrolase, NlpC family [Shimia marina]